MSEFIEFPFTRYRDDPSWVPPFRAHERARFDRAHHPFYGHATVDLFLARDGAAVVGRIGVIDDRRHNETWRDDLAAFGYFEAAGAEAAYALLAHAESWARARGRSLLRGPLNPSLHDSAGLLVDGFGTPPMLMMPHNPQEYAAYVEGAGFHAVKDLYAWLFEVRDRLPPAIDRLAARAQARHGFTIRAARPERFEAELQRFRTIYSRAWEHNWGFVPPTAEEFRNLAALLEPIADPALVLCAEVAGEPVACAVAVPDVNQLLRGTNGRLWPALWWRLLRRRGLVDQGRLLLLGVLPEHRHRGLYPALLAELWRRARHRYRQVEFSWVLEDNDDINVPARAAGAVRYKTYRLYQKPL